MPFLAIPQHDYVFLSLRLLKLFLEFCQVLYLVHIILLPGLKQALLPHEQCLNVLKHVLFLLVESLLDLNENLLRLLHLCLGLGLQQG